MSAGLRGARALGCFYRTRMAAPRCGQGTFVAHSGDGVAGSFLDGRSSAVPCWLSFRRGSSGWSPSWSSSRISARPSDSRCGARATTSRALPTAPTRCEAFQRRLPDLVVLDILMPRSTASSSAAGSEPVSARSRSSSSPRATRSSTPYSASSSGADDYLCKPFSMPQLIARVPVLFRRAALGREPGPVPVASGLTLGGLTFDFDRHRLAGTCRRRPHGHRVPDRGRPRAPPRPRQDPRAAARAGLPPRRVRQRADHRLAHQADPRQVHGDRSDLRRHRYRARPGYRYRDYSP